MDAKILALYFGCDIKVININRYLKVTRGWYQGRIVKLKSDTFFDIANHPDFFKPLLRPLRSITTEEAKEANIELGQILLAQIPKEAGLKFFTPRQYLWFLEKRFDLYGLIEKGEAMDLTENSVVKEPHPSLTIKGSPFAFRPLEPLPKRGPRMRICNQCGRIYTYKELRELKYICECGNTHKS